MDVSARSGSGTIEFSARAAGARTRTRPHVRLLDGMRRTDNWLQLVRFGVVGGTGFALNLAIFALLVHPLGIVYQVAAAAAWIIAGVNNFVWNRQWTFKARHGQVHAQAMKFLVVSLLALGFNELVLTLLVEGAGLSQVVAQVLALAASTPLNFLGNKLWSFKVQS